MTKWNDVTRSTEEEHQRFMTALKKLSFTKEEFITHGPAIVLKKYIEFLREMKEEDDERRRRR